MTVPIYQTEQTGRRDAIGAIDRLGVSWPVTGGLVQVCGRGRGAAVTGCAARELTGHFGRSTRTVLHIGNEAALARRRVRDSPRRLWFVEHEPISRGSPVDRCESEIARASGASYQIPFTVALVVS
jgi:hypothetical protein